MEIVRILAKNKKAAFFVADAVLVALSVWLAFMIRFEAAIPGQYIEIIARLVLIGWIFYLPALAAHRLYSFFVVLCECQRTDRAGEGGRIGIFAANRGFVSFPGFCLFFGVSPLHDLCRGVFCFCPLRRDSFRQKNLFLFFPPE